MALVVVYTLKDLLGSHDESFHHKGKGQIRFCPFLLLEYPHRAGNPLGLSSQGTSALQCSITWARCWSKTHSEASWLRTGSWRKGHWKIQDAVYLFEEKQHCSTLQLPYPMTLGWSPPHWLLTVKVVQIWIKMGREMEAAATHSLDMHRWNSLAGCPASDQLKTAWRLYTNCWDNTQKKRSQLNSPSMSKLSFSSFFLPSMWISFLGKPKQG